MKTYATAHENTTNIFVLQCIDKANELLNSPKFQSDITSKPGGYKFSNCTGMIISNCIQNLEKTMEVHLYKSKNPWSKARGYYTGKHPNRIHLNTRWLRRAKGSVTATVVHEIVHAADSENDEYFFGHDNKNRYIPAYAHSAPYWIDNLAEIRVDNKPIAQANTDESKNITRFSWWKPWTWFM
jgi:hypothetical protein